jgi:SAM-dependent methyltransferase
MELYRAEQLPVLQNRVFRTEAEAKACAKGDVILVQDPCTGLVHNAAFRSDVVKYDSNYQNEQAVSTAFCFHLDEVTQIIERHFHGLSIIEIGCGKAYFLERLQQLGFAVTGIDPAYEGNNPRVLRRSFTCDLGVKAEVIILRHVLEHIQNPILFLEEMREANQGSGLIYIEVPFLDWIIQHRAWFDIFYEHVNYFRLDDFKRIFAKVLEAGHLFGGQYLYVVADIASLRDPALISHAPIEFPSDFTGAIGNFAQRIRNSKVPAVVWGGASKGVIFSLFMQRAGAAIG